MYDKEMLREIFCHGDIINDIINLIMEKDIK